MPLPTEPTVYFISNSTYLRFKSDNFLKGAKIYECVTKPNRYGPTEISYVAKENEYDKTKQEKDEAEQQQDSNNTIINIEEQPEANVQKIFIIYDDATMKQIQAFAYQQASLWDKAASWAKFIGIEVVDSASKIFTSPVMSFALVNLPTILGAMTANAHIDNINSNNGQNSTLTSAQETSIQATYSLCYGLLLALGTHLTGKALSNIRPDNTIEFPSCAEAGDFLKSLMQTNDFNLDKNGLPGDIFNVPNAAPATSNDSTETSVRSNSNTSTMSTGNSNTSSGISVNSNRSVLIPMQQLGKSDSNAQLVSSDLNNNLEIDPSSRLSNNTVKQKAKNQSQSNGCKASNKSESKAASLCSIL